MMGSGRLNSNAPQPRDYQRQIAGSVLEGKSALVVLPTGLGKTLIAFIVAEGMLPKGPVLFCAPTKPLAAQHYSEAKRLFDLADEEIILVSGEIPAKKRQEAYPPKNAKARLVFSTPQTIRNDIGAGRLDWNFSLLVLDEVHRAVGKYAYAALAEEAKKNRTLVLGLTASPGSQKKKIEEITALLGVENVQIRTLEDADVAKYAQPLSISYIEVDLPPAMEDAKKSLREMMGEKMNTLRKMGFPGKFASKKELVAMRAKILASRSPLRFSALSQHSTLFSLSHCLELLETQGVGTLLKFVQKIRERKESKAQLRLLNDARFVRVVEKMKLSGEHPKLERLLVLLKEKQAANPALKCIVFCQYRDQAGLIAKTMQERGMRANVFMGKKDGITAQGQKETLENFRKGAFDVLVATSIGEEGLDIPSVDMVVFYEPVPSEIRSIQRRGRAGRAKVGEIYMLITRGTLDQGFFYASRKREERMKRIVGRMAGREYAPAKTEYSKVQDAKEDTAQKKQPAKKIEEKKAGDKKNAMKKNEGKKMPSSSKQTTMSDYF